jgi:hypothetical protein
MFPLRLPRGLSLRLEPVPDEPGVWTMVVRNDGPATVRELLLFTVESGYDFNCISGPSLGKIQPINDLHPGEEWAYGHFQFHCDVDYHESPLTVQLVWRRLHALTALEVTKADLPRLDVRHDPLKPEG